MPAVLRIIVDSKSGGSGLADARRDVEALDRAADQAGGGGISRLGSALGTLGGIAAGAATAGVAALSGLAAMGIQANAAAEQTSAAFTTLLGSGEAAKEFLDDLRDFAAATPFEFPELADAARKLLAFGFAAEEILPMMTAIGDAVGALGGGQAEIDRVTMALGQMRAKGKVSAEEMMQLAELGIPAWKMLADSMGITTAEAMKLAEKGLIPADTAIQALLGGMEETFGGAMQTQATTFNGLLSTLKDNANMALMAFTGPLFDAAKGALEQLGTAVSSPAFQEFAKLMGEQLGSSLAVVIDAVQRLVGVFTSAAGPVEGLTAVFASISGVLAGFGAQIVTQAQMWAQALGQWIIDAMPGMGANLATFLQGLLTWIGTALPPLVAQLATWGAQFVQWLIQATPILLTELGVFLNSMLTWLINSLPSIVAQLGTWAAQFVSWLVDVTPQLLVAAGELLAQFIIWLAGVLPQIQPKLNEWQAAFTRWLIEVTPKVIEEAKKLGDRLFSYLGELAGRLTKDGSVGKAIIDGIKAGINSAIESLKQAAANAAKAALDAAKAALGIQSPSLVFEQQVGAQITAGMARGIIGGIPAVEGASSAAAGAAVGAASTTINNTYNYAPTYSGAPARPTEDFAMMRALAGAGV